MSDRSGMKKFGASFVAAAMVVSGTSVPTALSFAAPDTNSSNVLDASSTQDMYQNLLDARANVETQKQTLADEQTQLAQAKNELPGAQQNLNQAQSAYDKAQADAAAALAAAKAKASEAADKAASDLATAEAASNQAKAAWDKAASDLQVAQQSQQAASDRLAAAKLVAQGISQETIAATEAESLDFAQDAQTSASLRDTYAGYLVKFEAEKAQAEEVLAQAEEALAQATQTKNELAAAAERAKAAYDQAQYDLQNGAASLTQLNNDLATAKTTLSAAAKRVSDLEASISSKEATVASLQNRISQAEEAEATYASLIEQRNQVSADLSSSQSEKASLEAEVAQNNQRIAALESEVASLQESFDYSAQTARIDAAEAAHDQAVEAFAQGSLGYFASHNNSAAINVLSATAAGHPGFDATDAGDPTSLAGMKRSIEALYQYMDLRAHATGIANASNQVLVSDVAMATAQWHSAFASASYTSHASVNHPVGAENLAAIPDTWTPWEGWYFKGKGLYDKNSGAASNIGYVPSGVNASRAKTNYTKGYSGNASTTSEYLNIVSGNTNWTATGIAVTNGVYQSYSGYDFWAQEFVSSANGADTRMTLDQYYADFMSYYNQVIGNLSSTQAEYDAAVDALEAAKKNNPNAIRADECMQEIEELQDANAARGTSIAQLQATIDQLNKQATSIESQLGTVSSKRLSASDLTKVRAQLQTAQTELDQLKGQLQQAQADKTAAQFDVDNTQARINSINDGTVQNRIAQTGAAYETAKNEAYDAILAMQAREQDCMNAEQELAKAIAKCANVTVDRDYFQQRYLDMTEDSQLKAQEAQDMKEKLAAVEQAQGAFNTAQSATATAASAESQAKNAYQNAYSIWNTRNVAATQAKNTLAAVNAVNALNIASSNLPQVADAKALYAKATNLANTLNAAKTALASAQSKVENETADVERAQAALKKAEDELTAQMILHDGANLALLESTLFSVKTEKPANASAQMTLKSDAFFKTVDDGATEDDSLVVSAISNDGTFASFISSMTLEAEYQVSFKIDNAAAPANFGSLRLVLPANGYAEGKTLYVAVKNADGSITKSSVKVSGGHVSIVTGNVTRVAVLAPKSVGLTNPDPIPTNPPILETPQPETPEAPEPETPETPEPPATEPSGEPSEEVAAPAQHRIAKGDTFGGSVQVCSGPDSVGAPTLYPKAGEVVYFRTVPELGYTLTRMSFTTADGQTMKLDRVSGTGKAGTVSTYTFVMPDCDVTLNAEFGVNKRPITKNVTDGCNLMLCGPDGKATSDTTIATMNPVVGQTVYFRAVAAPGFSLAKCNYQFTDESGNVVTMPLTSEGGGLYSFTMPNYNVTLNGVFEQR